MKNNNLNFNDLAIQKMNGICYLTTKKLGRIIITKNKSNFNDLQQVCSPRVRGLTGNALATTETIILFPASTGINRNILGLACGHCSVPREYGD